MNYPVVRIGICFILLKTSWAACNSQQAYSYLECVKKHLDRNSYLTFENELDQTIFNKADRCFNNPGQCRFESDLLTLDPRQLIRTMMSQCRACSSLALRILNLFKTASFNTKTCVRQKIGDLVAEAMGPCVRQTFPQIYLNSVPDFDEFSAYFEDDILNTISHFVAAWYRLEQCHLNTVTTVGERYKMRYGVSMEEGSSKYRTILPKSTYTSSASCFAGYTPYELSTHCNAIDQCKQQACSSIEALEATTCSCLQLKKDRLVERVREIRNKILDIQGGSLSNSQKISQCVDTINRELKEGDDGIDYSSRIEDLLRSCIDNAGETNLGNLLNTGCKLLTSDSGGRLLTIGFRFGQSFLEAMFSRIDRFCDGPHCV